MVPQRSNAQFWKKIFGNHKKEAREKRESDKANIHENTISALERISPTYPPTVKKERYRIDVLLPVALNKYVTDGRLVSPNLPPSLIPVINFYEGILLSARRLNSEDIKIDLHIHDAGEEGKNVQQLLVAGSLQNSDLIIGYLQSEQLEGVAQFAEKNRINFLSAFSPSDAGISGNPYFVILQPTLETHINKIASFGERTFPGIRPVFLYADKTAVQKESKDMFEKALKNKQWDSLSCFKFLNNPQLLINLLDSNQTNVIILNLLSYQEAATVLKKLKDLPGGYKFSVLGMPTWKNLPGISNNKTYQNIDIYFSCPFYFDLRSVRGNAFALNYRNAFGGNPSEMVFRGYETLYWAALLLNNYGTIFNNHIQDSRMAPYTRYDITPSWSSKNKFEYLENKNLYIFHYNNGYSNIVN